MVNSQDDYYHLPDYAEIDAKQGDEESLRLRTNSSPSSLRSAYPEPAICRCCPCDMYNYVVLTLICSLTFGSYWVFDTPGAIETGLKEWFGPSYTSKMNLDLYSVYSWPNTVLAFFGGYIIDKVTGIRMGTTLFCGLIFIGQIVFLLGINMKAYWICLLGRFIFGLGGESLTVAQNTFTLRWFEGPQLALAFGLVVSFSRVGSAVNFIVTPWMSSHFTVPASVGFGTLMCFFSFVSCLVLYVMDYYGEPRLEAKKAAAAVAAGTDSAPASPRLGQSDDDSDMEGWAQAGGQAGSSMTAWEKAVTAVTFPSSAWMLFVITMFFYIGVLTFNTIASSIMQHTGQFYDEDTATLFLAIPNFISIFASPYFGGVVDKHGRALYWILGASLMMVLAQLAFLALAMDWLFIHPAIITSWLGIGYAMGSASLWPILSLIVDSKRVGTAYGFMTAVQNFGLAVFPMIIGTITDQYTDDPDNKMQYVYPIVIFIACEVMAFVLTVLLVGIDRATTEGRLNASAREIELINLRKKELTLTRANSKVLPVSRKQKGKSKGGSSSSSDAVSDLAHDYDCEVSPSKGKDFFRQSSRAKSSISVIRNNIRQNGTGQNSASSSSSNKDQV